MDLAIESASGGAAVLAPAPDTARRDPSRPASGGGGNDGAPGGGRGDGRDGPEDRYQPSFPVSAPVFAMVLLQCTVIMLFAGLVAGYLVLRMGSGGAWPPAGLPPLPATLWIPTALAVLSSVTLGLAQGSARRGDQPALVLRLGATTFLGLAFLGAQGLIWQGLFGEGLVIRHNVYGANFYVLTGLHALHMVSGVIALVVTLWRARAGRYTAGSHVGVRLTAMYWHFLGGLWVFLFAILYLV